MFILVLQFQVGQKEVGALTLARLTNAPSTYLRGTAQWIKHLPTSQVAGVQT